MKNGFVALSEGLMMVMRHLFKKPITQEYPEKRRQIPTAFRGKPVVKGCVGCGVCKKVCPAGAISFHKDFDGNVTSYTFDLKKCIFCGNCAFYCPHQAITMSGEYELGTNNDLDLKLTYRGGVDD